MPEIIGPTDIQFLSTLHEQLNQLVLTCAEKTFGEYSSIILDKPVYVSGERVGNKCSLRFDVPARVPGQSVRVNLQVTLAVNVHWRNL